MVRTMREGVRSSQGQVEDMRRRLERLETLVEINEASGPEMEVRTRAEERPETAGPQVDRFFFIVNNQKTFDSLRIGNTQPTKTRTQIITARTSHQIQTPSPSTGKITLK